MGIGRAGRFFVAAALAVATFAVSAPTADAASTWTGTDPVGDPTGLYDPRGDVVAFTGTSTATHVIFTVKTLAFDDPATSPNWKFWGTVIYFDFYVEGGYDDFGRILMYNDGTHVVADPDFPCTGAVPGWDAATSTYTMTVPIACLGAYSGVQAYVYFDYETPTTYSEDDTDLVFFHRLAPPGYWMVTAAGTVYPFGSVANFGNAPFGWSVVDLEASPDGLGYWLLDASGVVQPRGTASWWGDARNMLLPGERATAISATPYADGYWIFTNLGRVLTFGDAVWYGDMSDARLNGEVIDSIVTPSGRGYYMVAADGGIFAFGDAVFYGSMGGIRLNAAVQSLVPDPDGVGYWLVASDGGVFAFQAPFVGSMGSTKLNRPVTGMVPFGNGYLMVGEDGGIFNFSNKPFYGSLGANPPGSPVVAVAAGS